MTSVLMTPEEAARVLGLSPFTVRRLLREGELPGRKVGKRQWRIRSVDLEEYLGSSSTPGNAIAAAGEQLPPPRSLQGHEIADRISRLAVEQGVRPVEDFDRLLGEAWVDVGENRELIRDGIQASADDFLAPIRELRENSPARGEI